MEITTKRYKEDFRHIIAIIRSLNRDNAYQVVDEEIERKLDKRLKKVEAIKEEDPNGIVRQPQAPTGTAEAINSVIKQAHTMVNKKFTYYNERELNIGTHVIIPIDSLKHAIQCIELEGVSKELTELDRAKLQYLKDILNSSQSIKVDLSTEAIRRKAEKLTEGWDHVSVGDARRMYSQCAKDLLNQE